MKFSVLSGAYVNAGDFLIVDRTIKLLKHIYPGCEIDIYERRKNLEDYLKIINQSDALILAGGPAYLPNVYPEVIPLVDRLDKITTKIVSVGLGWCGENTTKYYMYEQYKFSESTKKLLERIVKDSGNLTCRDWYTAQILKVNGFDNVIMTGCPAWYNLECINENQIRKNNNIPFKKICISDPANTKNFEQALNILKYIKKKFPEAELIFVFHRVEKNLNVYESFKKKIENEGVNTVNISYSSNGFNVYDDCDLHIGYRVHAHIYNLSNRNISILIEEDGRGIGVNNTLGLTSITAYEENDTKIHSKTFCGKVIRFLERKMFKIGNYKINDYIIEELESYFTMLFNHNFMQFNTAFFNMQMYYHNMEEHIKKIQ